MAKDKTSFLLYSDVWHTVEKLTDEQSGRLFKHILRYVNDQNPVLNDIIIELVFEPIKQSLKRDLKKYEAICLRNRDNGQKGGRPKKKPKKPSGLITNPKNPDEPDNDSDSDSDLIKKRKNKEYIEDQELNSLFIDFLEMRKQIKKPATEKAIELLLKKLETIKNKKGSLELSIVKNYQGLFEPKYEQQIDPEKPRLVR